MSAPVSELHACLEEEIRLTGEFLAVLQDEAKVLEDGAAEAALAETTARKNTLAEALAAAAERRNAALAALGFEADGAGLEAAAQAHSSLAAPRRQLLEAAEQARNQNEANGRIIEVFLDHNQRTLEVLRRLTGTGEIYDASGRKRAPTKGSSRNIKAG